MTAPDQTNTFPADAIGNPEPVFVDNYALYGASSGIRRVRIWENASKNTASYIVHEPLMTSPGVIRSVGQEYEFTKAGGGCYGSGEIAGYVELEDTIANPSNPASATFAKQEMAI